MAPTQSKTQVHTEVDVVAMPSLRADGTPDQTASYKVLDADGNQQAASTFEDPRPFTQETPLVADTTPPPAVEKTAGEKPPVPPATGSTGS